VEVEVAVVREDMGEGEGNEAMVKLESNALAESDALLIFFQKYFRMPPYSKATSKSGAHLQAKELQDAAEEFVDLGLVVLDVLA